MIDAKRPILLDLIVMPQPVKLRQVDHFRGSVGIGIRTITINNKSTIVINRIVISDRVVIIVLTPVKTRGSTKTGEVFRGISSTVVIVTLLGIIEDEKLLFSV